MRIILLGAPGAGKGTQAEFISKHLNIPRISTGDMLRAQILANTPIGQKVKSIMAQGLFVPEDIVVNLLMERLSEPDCRKGYLLDGFPRTLDQAEILEKSLEENLHSSKLSPHVGAEKFFHVIEIKVPDDEIIQRLSGRRFHVKSGRAYHITANPPKIPNLDDVTGEPLIHREDDKENTIRKRLEMYHQQTEPLTGWFKKRPERYTFKTIQGKGTIEDIRKQLETALENESVS